VKPERVVVVRPRTVLQVSGVLLGVVVVLWVVWSVRQVITWILIALFVAMVNPAVDLVQRRGIRRRAAAAGLVYLVAILVTAALSWPLVPPLVHQVSGFGQALPGYIDQLTAGQGPLGFLERD
jgi:predicted PurR-regulated permease PerM